MLFKYQLGNITNILGIRTLEYLNERELFVTKSKVFVICKILHTLLYFWLLLLLLLMVCSARSAATVATTNGKMVTWNVETDRPEWKDVKRKFLCTWMGLNEKRSDEIKSESDKIRYLRNYMVFIPTTFLMLSYIIVLLRGPNYLTIISTIHNISQSQHSSLTFRSSASRTTRTSI